MKSDAGRRGEAGVPVRFGYSTMNGAAGLLPAELARQLEEERGFEWMRVPERAHVPTSRGTPHPSTNPLPDGYLHMMDPLVSLAAAASVTERLVLGTAVCLVMQHDVVALAKAVASLDVISGGRVVLGVGTGWNEEEFADHRPDVPFRQRYSAMEEHVRGASGVVGGQRVRVRGSLGSRVAVVGVPEAGARNRADRAGQLGFGRLGPRCPLRR